MVTDFFDGFLQDLGKILNLPNLKADEHHTCLIKFKGNIQVQFEVDQSAENLIIGTDFGTITPGKYRERLFLEALKANALPEPRYGTFAYSKQADHLALYHMMPIKELSSGKVEEFLTPFLEKVKVWQEAITRGDIPVLATARKGAGPGMFGL